MVRFRPSAPVPEWLAAMRAAIFLLRKVLFFAEQPIYSSISERQLTKK